MKSLVHHVRGRGNGIPESHDRASKIRSRDRIAHLQSVLLAAALLIALTACAAGANQAVDVPSPDGDVAGFWLGLWHGIVVPITFIISLFSDTVSIYEIHNNGGWYDFGFVLGAGVFLGSGGAGTCRTRR